MRRLSIHHTRVEGALLLNFFLTFARFEYALKASGYFQRRNPRTRGRFTPPEARPDWDRFAVDLRTTFRMDRTRGLKEACSYVLENPPNRQVIVAGSVAWETPVRPRHETAIEFLLRMIRCVRNNLFHGGKHNIRVHEDTHRTELLLSKSLTILRECLRLAPQVRREFNRAVI